MFYLIGVNHDAQRYDDGVPLSRDQDQLKQCMIEAIDRIQPDIVGIEESIDSLALSISIPCELATNRINPIQCILCDPCKSYRSQHKLFSHREILREIQMSEWNFDIQAADHSAAAMALEFNYCFPLREEFWMGKMADFVNSHVIFVLGDHHIESFSERLRHRGLIPEVVARGIGANQQHANQLLDAKLFQINNQDLFDRLLRWYTSD
jgi:hypothetical protein